MALRYTQIPVNTFQKLSINAGVIVDSFTPDTGVIGNILGATTGGVNVTATPSFVDFGEDIDNCPKNTKELMRTDEWTVTMSGTMLTVDAARVAELAALADVDLSDDTHVVFRRDIELTDFHDVWFVGDYGVGGYIAIHMKSVLSTGGFQIQTADKGKGTFPFTYTAHFSIDAQDDVPIEVFVVNESTEIPYVTLDKTYLELPVGGTFTFSPAVYPANQTVSYTSSATGKASVTSAGKVTAAEAGSTTITATITVNSIAYTDTCTVKVTE